MAIGNVKLVMMSLAAVLAAQHFPHEVGDWEGLPAASDMWQAWKVALCLAHLKGLRQLQALGGSKPIGDAHTVITTAALTIDHISEALENLVLMALNDTTVLQQLMAANLALTATVTLLTAANKKLADLLAQNKGDATPAAAPAMRKGSFQTSLSQGTVAGLMVIRSIRITGVQPVDTRLQDTRTMRQAPT
jgi:hypothetical protein